MEVYFSTVDWTEAESRDSNGTFASDADESLDEGTWIQCVEYEDVLSVVFSLGAACDAILKECSESNKAVLEAAFGRFMTEEPSLWNELPEELDPECYWIAIGPDTVRDLNAAMSRINFAELASLYEQHCPREVKDSLGYTGVTFAEHLKSWCDVFRDTSKESRGLVVSVG